jgi:hypothetical protein
MAVSEPQSDKEECMKKIGLLTLVVVMTFVLALAFTATAAPVPPPHPRVEHALEAMRSAKDHMEHSEGEFHGHRAKAVEHLDMAIHEAEICMQEP